MRTSTIRRPVQVALAVAIMLASLVLAGGGAAYADTDTSPISPPKPPPGYGYQVTDDVIGIGQQIYRCQLGAGRYQWTFVEPTADLFLNGQWELRFGSHSAGPTWRHLDGSWVVGEMVASMPSPSGSIPWLLLRAKSTGFGPSGGAVLARTAYIQRTNTTGGLPPTDRCDGVTAGRVKGVDYTAKYTFYQPWALY